MPTGFCGVDLVGVGGDDVAVSAVVEDGFAALRFRQRAEERAGLVFLRREHPQAGARPFRHVRRIRAKEARRVHGHVIPGEREVERQVMPFEPPPPGIGAARLAVDGEVVALRIAHQAERLDFAQNELQLDDVDDLAVADGREPFAQQRVHGIAATRVQLLQAPRRCGCAACSANRGGRDRRRAAASCRGRRREARRSRARPRRACGQRSPWKRVSPHGPITGGANAARRRMARTRIPECYCIAARVAHGAPRSRHPQLTSVDITP